MQTGDPHAFKLARNDICTVVHSTAHARLLRHTSASGVWERPAAIREAALPSNRSEMPAQTALAIHDREADCV